MPVSYTHLEIIEAHMTDVIQKSYFYLDAQIKEYKLKKPLNKKIWFSTVDTVFDMAHNMADAIAKMCIRDRCRLC